MIMQAKQIDLIPKAPHCWYQPELSISGWEHVWNEGSSTKERRAMVYACRALRVQIKYFEDDFRSAVGYSPRGSDRLPLASTYRQYREWKRGIRDHASSKIQSLMQVARGTACLRTRILSHLPKADVAKHKKLLLADKKHQLKQQLKDYDARFLWKHGRPPLKFEKEPIRDLYEAYHTIKARLAIYSRTT